MERINERYKYPISPLADSAAEIRGDKYRFTILTSRLIRIEYNENGHFENRATQTVVNRRFDVPEFKVYQDDEKLHILTDNISITYYTGRKFTQNSLSAKFRGKNNDSWNTWYFGTGNSEVIGGTARTLDNVNGEIELRDGLMSKRRITQFDDSKSLILSEDGWIDCREDQCVDLYLFAYADDYYGAYAKGRAQAHCAFGRRYRYGRRPIRPH